MAKEKETEVEVPDSVVKVGEEKQQERHTIKQKALARIEEDINNKVKLSKEIRDLYNKLKKELNNGN